MSVEISHTTALSALVVDRHRCCSAQCVASIAFEMARSDETQRQRRSFNTNLPIERPQSQDPCALTASGTRHAKLKLP